MKTAKTPSAPKTALVTADLFGMQVEATEPIALLTLDEARVELEELEKAAAKVRTRFFERFAAMRQQETDLKKHVKSLTRYVSDTAKAQAPRAMFAHGTYGLVTLLTMKELPDSMSIDELPLYEVKTRLRVVPDYKNGYGVWKTATTLGRLRAAHKKYYTSYYGVKSWSLDEARFTYKAGGSSVRVKREKLNERIVIPKDELAKLLVKRLDMTKTGRKP